MVFFANQIWTDLKQRKCTFPWVAMGFALVLAAFPLSASSRAPEPPSPAGTRPDFSGVWVPSDQTRTPFEFLPAAKKIFDKNHKGVIDGDINSDPNFRCLPSGFPRGMMGKLPFWVFQSPDAVGLIGEGGGRPRVIYINHKHVENLWPQFMGDSTATWDSDTLVIDTVNFADETWLANDGTPHSDALHVVERWRLIGNGIMEDKMTIDDPKIFKAPWVVTNIEKRDMSIRPQESVCQNTRLRP